MSLSNSIITPTSFNRRRRPNRTPRRNLITANVTTEIMSVDEKLPPRPPPPRPQPPQIDSNVLGIIIGSVVILCLTAIIIAVIAVKKKKPRSFTRENRIRSKTWNQASGVYETVGPALPIRNTKKDTHTSSNYNKQERESINTRNPPIISYNSTGANPNEHPDVNENNYQNQTNNIQLMPNYRWATSNDSAYVIPNTYPETIETNQRKSLDNQLPTSSNFPAELEEDEDLYLKPISNPLQPITDENNYISLSNEAINKD